jgi:acetyl-CoA C-acetyltransferase
MTTQKWERGVAVVGIGQTDVGEHWDTGLRQLAFGAVDQAIKDANIEPGQIDAVIVGNALGGLISNQNHLGALVADFMGIRGTEAFRVEGADASGGLALRQGCLMIASGLAETVLVVGLEKVTDLLAGERLAALSATLDFEYEAAMGATPVALMAMLMRRYMHEYGVSIDKFANFSVNAHANGSKNPRAMFRNLIRADRFAGAPLVAEPINLFDVAPEADGAAAVILTSSERAADRVPNPVQILASTVGTDTLAIHDRPDPLFLSAANVSARDALKQAGIDLNDLDVLELHDSSTILSTLAIEAIGLAERGKGWTLAQQNEIGLAGKLPISTFGGLKARGNPLGATGLYQAVEAVMQLRGAAGANQVPNAKIAMTQNLGGVGSTAVTHIFGN